MAARALQHEQDQDDLAALRLQIANHQNIINSATKSDQLHMSQLSELQRLHEEDQKALTEGRARAVKDISDLNAQHQLEVVALQQQAQLLEHDRTTAVKDTTTALQEVALLQQQVASLQQLVEEMGGQLKQVELTSIDALQRNAEMDQDNENLRKHIEALLLDKDNHQQQLQVLLVQIDALQKSYDEEKNNYHRQVDTTTSTYQEEVSILQKEIVVLKSEIQDYHTQFTAQKEVMEDMEQHMKQCELATIAALKQGM